MKMEYTGETVGMDEFEQMNNRLSNQGITARNQALDSKRATPEKIVTELLNTMNSP